MKMMNTKRGAAGVVDIAVGAIMVVILVVAVAYPILVDVVTNITPNSSTDSLILKYLPTILLVVALVAMAAFLYFKGK